MLASYIVNTSAVGLCSVYIEKTEYCSTGAVTLEQTFARVTAFSDFKINNILLLT